MTLPAALASATRIGVDTAPLIYFIEKDPKYANLLHTLFGRTVSNQIQLVTSVVSLTEVLTRPIQVANAELNLAYRDMLLGTVNVLTLPVTPEIAIRAAELRGIYRLRTPDALQLATALVSQAELFLTNDSKLKRVTDIPVILLSDFA